MLERLCFGELRTRGAISINSFFVSLFVLFLFSFVFFFLTVQISVKFEVGKKKHKEDESLQRIASNFYVVIIRFQKKLSSLQRKLNTWRKKSSSRHWFCLWI